MIKIEFETIEKLNFLSTKEENNSIIFHFIFKTLNVRCIYFGNSRTMIIGFSGRNSAWNLNLSNRKISEFIPNEAYKLISDVLKEEKTYSNKDFFITLKDTIENLKEESVNPVTENQILEALKETKTRDKNYDKEGEKPFFDHWRRVKPSKESLNKIQRYFGDKVRKQCFYNSVTAV
ncbi:hypothetical protein [uncultured Aquimarina sp.]|uniref:hypothetical protein n=1 Tax=uncultured Aquimarina sp. TaxID=575652 RepID=UPI00260CD4B9|nr:hypothetical protein [uncultured Aquimarina sp.]